MCGVFGAVRVGGTFDERAHRRFVELTDRVAHRGPDGSGYRCFDTRCGAPANPASFDLFLGHRRLSIIDLSDAGLQPLTDGSGVWISYNGEVFNYVELRAELERLGHAFHTATDTEVILKVYHEYGPEGFDRLNGMWAFALLDLPRHRLILSRDRFSIKPLYYIRRGADLYFGSEIKQLTPLLERVRVNRQVMATYLRQAVADHSVETFFEDVCAVPPKHSLIVDLSSGNTRLHQYWDYRFGAGNGADPVEHFRELFVDSVRIRLRSDVKVGVPLSGGLDSSGIACVAHDVLGSDVGTYSVVSEGRFSEERFVNVVVAEKRLASQRIRFQPEHVLEGLRQVIYQNDEPFMVLGVVAQHKMFETIKRETDATVFLSGQGGDEILLGYSKFFFFHVQELLARGRLVAALRCLGASALQGTTVWQFHLGEAQRYLPARWQRRDPAYVLVDGSRERLGRAATMRERQVLDIDRYSVPALTHYEDRNSMAFSLEIRLPFLDHRLVEFVVGLPTEIKLRGGWTKYLARAALPELPEVIRWRRDKQGFITPEQQWLRHDLRPLIEETFQNSRLADLGLVDPRAFLSYYQEFLQGRRGIWYTDISRVLIAELWARVFLDQAAA